MATLFVRHQVKDYGQWKRVYDQFAPTRKKLGVTAAGVYRDADEPNTLVVTHEFKNLDAARAFSGSEELRSAMTEAGVDGPPEMWFTEDIERTSN